MAFFNFCYVSLWFKILSVSFVFQCGLFCLGLNPISEVRGWVGIWRRWYGWRRVWIDLSRNNFKSSFSDLKYKRYVPKNCSTTSVDVVTVHLFLFIRLMRAFASFIIFVATSRVESSPKRNFSKEKLFI